MNLNQLQIQLNRQINVINERINAFFGFVVNKLKNFKNLTLGEQIAFGVVGGGLLLILISIILFIAR